MFGAARSQVKSVPPIGVPFAPIPLDVMARRDLSPAAKLVFAAVANNARMRRGDRSRMTNAQIAAAVGMTASGVRRPLDELEAAGLIERAYEAAGRVREAIRVTYEVGAPASTRAAAVEPQRQPGCHASAPGVGAPTSAPSCSKNEEPGEKAIVSTLGEENGELDPKPGPAEIAAAMRAMVAGKYAPQVFDAEPRQPSPATGLADLARLVGYSARAAAGFTRRPPSPAPRGPAASPSARPAQPDHLRDLRGLDALKV